MVEILDLSYRKPRTQKSEFPFLIVNLVCRFPKGSDDETYFVKALSLSAETYRLLASKTEKDLEKRNWEWVWTFNDKVWRYLPKFGVFWFRQWVTDCSVTRSVLRELRYYQENGKFPFNYRHLDEGVLIRHVRTLDTYWD